MSQYLGPISSESSDIDDSNGKANAFKQHQSAFDINLKHVCIFAIFMPIVAFFTCICISLLKDFEDSNKTHCKVRNLLPSISSAISRFYPQIAIWRLLIGIDSFPRYFIAYIYFKKYYLPKKDLFRYPHAYECLIRIAFFIHLVELTSLLLLSYVSSVEIFSVHKISFISFLTCSLIFMILTVATHFWPIHERHKFSVFNEQKELKSKKLKIGILFVYISCMLLSLYFYIRHNMYCEPYIYSFFSFFEYLIVFTNITYHSIIIYDLNLFQREYKITFIDSICKVSFD